MSGSEVTYLVWNDFVNVPRTRGVPTRDLEKRGEAGLGWAMAGQALTPFTEIVANDFGPMGEARQVPDPAARFVIPGDDANPAIAGVICDSMTGAGESWAYCPRGMFRRALEALKAETGLSLMAAFEHEFNVTGDGAPAETPFSLAAARHRHALLLDIERMVSGAGVTVETVEPEYGVDQYEVSCAPEPGVKAADAALITREAIREAARRRGLRATFTPKLHPHAVGNGAHIHLSLAAENGSNMTHDPAGPVGLSDVAAAFCAGILAHVDALVAVTAPAPVSYWRLGPGHWSCGFRAIGLQNREATLRITPGISRDPARARRGFNIEYRPTDGCASPYLTLALLVQAGLDGIRRRLPLPVPIDRDPAELSAAEKRKAGVRPLPASLEAALDALEADRAALGWLGPGPAKLFLALKRWEAALAHTLPQAELFARYARAY
jgi:glutamine synthetase